MNMSNNMSNLVATVQPMKLILVYVPPQYEQFHREYESTLTNEGIDSINRATNGGNILTPKSLAGVAHNVMSPASVPGNVVNVPHGLGQERYAFYLEVHITSVTGTSREIISGFTSYNGISDSGAIDPEMTFHINSIVNVNTMISSVGMQQQSLVFSEPTSYQVLTSSNVSVGNVSMRPEDVVGVGQMANMLAGSDDGFMDTRCMIGGEPILSTRKHNITNEYIADTYNSFVSAYNSNGDIGDTNSDFYNDAYVNVRNASISEQNFIRAIGAGINGSSSQFTFGDITHTFQLPDNFYVVSRPNPGVMYSPMDDTEHWHGANMETKIAFALTHSMPALMNKYMLTRTTVTISNMNGTSTPEVLLGMDTTEMFGGTFTVNRKAAFIDDVIFNVIRGVMDVNVNFFSITMSLDIFSTSTLDISLNGNPAIRYVAPMYCDGYMAPVVGANMSSLNNVADAIGTVIGHVTPAVVEGRNVLNGAYDYMPGDNVPNDVGVWSPDSVLTMGNGDINDIF